VSAAPGGPEDPVGTGPNGGHPGQRFFLAMAHWQFGNKDEALMHYDQAWAY
jgi:hypothetical protein